MGTVLKNLYAMGRATYRSWRDDRTIRLGAGLAYYSLFTLIPILALTAALAATVFDPVDVQQYLVERITALGLVDADAVAQSMTDQMDRASVGSSLGLLGVVTLLFAASLVFLALADAVNAIWDVPVETGWFNTMRRRLMSFVMVLLTSGLLIADFAVTAVTGAAEALVPGNIELLEELAQLVNSVAVGVVLALGLALILHLMSPPDLVWKWAIVSSSLTAVGFEVSTAAVGWYLRGFGGASISGAFGALLAGLSWVYLEAQILLIGVQLSKVLSRWDPHLRSIAKTRIEAEHA